jgi:hypothetical protein
MASLVTLKNEIHIANCSTLNTLKAEADAFVVANSTLLNYARNHWYREYNRRKFFLCQRNDMISPYDGGFRPTTYTPSVSNVLLLEDGTDLLLEDGTNILLE